MLFGRGLLPCGLFLVRRLLHGRNSCGLERNMTGLARAWKDFAGRLTTSPIPQLVNVATTHYDSLVPSKWFGKTSMQRINVLSIARIGAEDRAKIEAVDPAIQLTDARSE